MTPTGIKLGRQYDARFASYSMNDAGQQKLVDADANRVALSASIGELVAALANLQVIIGYRVAGTFQALTCLTSGHPACYLSVDKIGTAVMGEIWAVNRSGDVVEVGVVNVRQVQELP